MFIDDWWRAIQQRQVKDELKDYALCNVQGVAFSADPHGV